MTTAPSLTNDAQSSQAEAAYELAQREPHIFLEQAHLLFADLNEYTAKLTYVHAAKKDPTNAVRLVRNYAARPFAADVLAAAYEAFPSALETYPAWKEFPELQAAVKEAIKPQRTSVLGARARGSDAFVSHLHAQGDRGGAPTGVLGR